MPRQQVVEDEVARRLNDCINAVERLHVAPRTGLDALGYTSGTPLQIDSRHDGVDVVSNDQHGAFPSYKVKIDGETVGLFKPVPDTAVSAFKTASCFQTPGSSEAREVFSSVWNELCGGLGDYPKTVPTTVTDETGDSQTGSVMAWRPGAREFAEFVEGKSWYVSLLEAKQVLLEHLQTNPGCELALEGERRFYTKEEIEALIAEAETETAALPQKKAEALDKVPDNDAHSLMALHLGTLQLDVENASNVMFEEMPDGSYHLIAIDGGLSAPNELIGDDFNPPLWLTWPQANKPWTEEQIAKFTSMPPIHEMAEGVEAQMGELASLVDVHSIHRTMASTLFMSLTAQIGTTPKQTYQLIRGNLEMWVKVAEGSLAADASLEAYAVAFEGVARAKLATTKNLPAYRDLNWEAIGL